MGEKLFLWGWIAVAAQYHCQKCDDTTVCTTGHTFTTIGFIVVVIE